MLAGEYNCKIDNKGRFILPIKLREKINKDETLVATRGYDGNIELYTQSEWKKVVENINSLNVLNEMQRRYRLFLLSAAQDIEIDTQGRINLPKELVEFSLLKKDIVVIGNYSSIQVWNKESWNEYINKTINDMPDILKKLGE